MKTVLHIGIWLAVLVVGVWAVGFVSFKTSQGGTGNGAGFFDYSFRSCYFPAFEEDPSMSMIELEGRAPRRFKVFGGVSPVYDAISLKWSLHSGYSGRPKGQVSLHLASETLTDGDRSVPLDVEHLLEVIGIPDRPANRDTLRYLMKVLEDCRTGRLPRPNHHGYELEEPMPGSMRHAALGYMVSYPVLAWVGLWLLAIPAFYTTKRMTNRVVKPRPS